MTVTTGSAEPERDWSRFDTPTGRRYRDLLIARAGARAVRVGDTEPMWSPTPIIGYRMWMMRPDGITGATGYRWPGRSITAVCRPQSAEARPGAPHRHAQQECPGLCGINAYATPRALVTAVGPAGLRQRFLTGMLSNGERRPESLYGVAALSGRVVEHEDGYRAEHATVVGLVSLYGPTVAATSDPRAIDALFRDVMSSGPWETQVTPEAANQIPATVVDQLRKVAQQCA